MNSRNNASKTALARQMDEQSSVNVGSQLADIIRVDLGGLLCLVLYFRELGRVDLKRLFCGTPSAKERPLPRREGGGGRRPTWRLAA